MPEPGATSGLPKRFYKQVAAEPEDGGYALRLDGRAARTPGKDRLVVPTAPLGEALAAEWEAQRDTIDPSTMPLTKLANSAIDGVAPRADEVRAEIVSYAGSDLVCYRAGEPDSLVQAQAAAWDPVVAWARTALGARLLLAEGVMFQEQPREAVAAIGSAVGRETSPFRLGALNVLTTMSGSALLALMLAAGALSTAEAWAAAHVDEVHQESLWGEDLEALRRRAAREREFSAAALLLTLVP